jgi:maleate isomerase
MDDVSQFPVLHVPHQLRARTHDGPRIGLLALESDATIEDEWRVLLTPENAGIYTARVPCDAQISAASLRATGQRLSGAARSVLPGLELDALVFACTSASMVLGEPAVHSALNTARPNVPVTTPLTAAKQALRALNARRVALLTPYVDAITLPLAEHLNNAGFEMTGIGSFHEADDTKVARIDPDSIRQAAHALVNHSPGTRPDALFIACTGLRASALIPELEATLKVSVTTSNHAMAWHALTLCQTPMATHSRGALFSSSG